MTSIGFLFLLVSAFYIDGGWGGCVETVRHAFHLVLRTKLSKLLCLMYRGFGKTSGFKKKFTKKLRLKRAKYDAKFDGFN